MKHYWDADYFYFSTVPWMALRAFNLAAKNPRRIPAWLFLRELEVKQLIYFHKGL